MKSIKRTFYPWGRFTTGSCQKKMSTEKAQTVKVTSLWPDLCYFFCVNGFLCSWAAASASFLWHLLTRWTPNHLTQFLWQTHMLQLCSLVLYHHHDRHDKGLFIYYVITDGGGGSSRFITILHRGGLPNLLQYYIGRGLERLLQYYSFERKMEGYNPFSALD